MGGGGYPVLAGGGGGTPVLAGVPQNGSDSFKQSALSGSQYSFNNYNSKKAKA